MADADAAWVGDPLDEAELEAEALAPPDTVVLKDGVPLADEDPVGAPLPDALEEDVDEGAGAPVDVPDDDALLEADGVGDDDELKEGVRVAWPL